MLKTIGRVHDRRGRDGAAQFRERSRQSQTRVDNDARIAELSRRVLAGEPLFRPGERYTPGYGAYQVGTLPDELPCDVLDNAGRENRENVDPIDDEEGDDDR